MLKEKRFYTKHKENYIPEKIIRPYYEEVKKPKRRKRVIIKPDAPKYIVLLWYIIIKFLSCNKYE